MGTSKGSRSSLVTGSLLVAVVAGCLSGTASGCSYGWTVGQPTPSDGGSSSDAAPDVAPAADAQREASCQELESDEGAALVFAKKCTTEGKNCATEPDKCGCPVYVGDGASAIDAYRETKKRLSQSGCVLADCTRSCPPRDAFFCSFGLCD